MRSAHSLTLNTDQMKVLIYARATGAVDNSACRDFSGLDTLAASRVLRRLRDRGLLDKLGGGSSTHFALPTVVDAAAEAGGRPACRWRFRRVQPNNRTTPPTPPCPALQLATLSLQPCHPSLQPWRAEPAPKPCATAFAGCAPGRR